MHIRVTTCLNETKKGGETSKSKILRSAYIHEFCMKDACRCQCAGVRLHVRRVNSEDSVEWSVSGSPSLTSQLSSLKHSSNTVTSSEM